MFAAKRTAVDSSRVEELQFQLNLTKIMEKSNVQLIEDQRKTIVDQAEEIRRLKKQLEKSEKRREDLELRADINLFTSNTFGRKLDKLEAEKKVTDSEAKELKKRNDKLRQELQKQNVTLRKCNHIMGILWDKCVSLALATSSLNKNVKNFPTDLSDQLERLSVDSDEANEVMEDTAFQKELAKRMTCKICLSDVERLRCSQCLKGICHGCHDRIDRSQETGEKKCPHCRSENDEFQHIIIPRI